MCNVLALRKSKIYRKETYDKNAIDRTSFYRNKENNMNIPNTFIHWLQEAWICHTKLQFLYLYYSIVTFIIYFYLKYLNIFRGGKKVQGTKQRWVDIFFIFAH